MATQNLPLEALNVITSIASHWQDLKQANSKVARRREGMICLSVDSSIARSRGVRLAKRGVRASKKGVRGSVPYFY